MESGADWTAGRNEDSVVSMENLRKARDSRVSSARRLREGWDNGANDLPFWEKDDPFGQRKKARRPERQMQQNRQSRPVRQAQPGRPAQPDRQVWQERQERAEVRPAQRDGRPKHARNSKPEPARNFRAQPDREYRPQPRQDGRRRDADKEPTENRRDARQSRTVYADDTPRRGAPRQPQYEERQPPRDYARAASGKREQGKKRASPKSHNGLLMLMALLALLSVTVVIGLNVFRIRSIDVKGDYSMSEQSIAALSGIGVGENIFKADLSRAKRNIESDPLLEVLSISRVFPDGISIEVRQRVPHGAIAYLGSYVIIDENGYVLDVRDNLPAGQYPLVTGVEIQPSEKGKTLQGVDGVQQKTMYDLLKALYDNKAIQYVSEANLGNGEGIRLLTGEGLLIDLGKPTDLDRKAQWIACSVPELRSRGYTTGVLYITGAENPVYSETGTVGDAEGGAADGSAQPSADGDNSGPDGAV